MGRRLLSTAAASSLLRYNVALPSETTISATDLAEFCEEEVWAAHALSSDDSGRTRWRQAADLADVRRHVGGLSKALEAGAAVAMSAPVAAALPEWRRMRTEQLGSAPEEGEWVPPHEYLARENGKSSMATSVCEGAGRTLKGRDLSRVRDAIWIQTGFFG